MQYLRGYHEYAKNAVLKGENYRFVQKCGYVLTYDISIVDGVFKSISNHGPVTGPMNVLEREDVIEILVDHCIVRLVLTDIVDGFKYWHTSAINCPRPQPDYIKLGGIEYGFVKDCGYVETGRLTIEDGAIVLIDGFRCAAEPPFISTGKTTTKLVIGRCFIILEFVAFEYGRPYWRVACIYSVV